MEVKVTRFLEVKASPRGSLTDGGPSQSWKEQSRAACSELERRVSQAEDLLRSELERRVSQAEELLRKHRELQRVERCLWDLDCDEDDDES